MYDNISVYKIKGDVIYLVVSKESDWADRPYLKQKKLKIYKMTQYKVRRISKRIRKNNNDFEILY